MLLSKLMLLVAQQTEPLSLLLPPCPETAHSDDLFVFLDLKVNKHPQGIATTICLETDQSTELSNHAVGTQHQHHQLTNTK